MEPIAGAAVLFGMSMVHLQVRGVAAPHDKTLIILPGVAPLEL
jgi:hypothetical protein